MANGTILFADSDDGITTAAIGDRDATLQAHGVRLASTSTTLAVTTDMHGLRPRVILVERHGALAGLVTVKDVLRFIATSEKASHSGDPLPGEAGGLEEFLEELYTSSSMLVERFITRCRGVLTSRR